MDERAIVEAIRRAGYVPFVYRRWPAARYLEIFLLNGTAPKVKWFGVLQRKLARQGIDRIIGYGGNSPYVERLHVAYEPPAADAH